MIKKTEISYIEASQDIQFNAFINVLILKLDIT